ncbi:adenylate/guanylate cyclase domain-containing protein [Amorphus sp. 3PC139-8]|uniref:adenylate/guanylate cyclase domain-containing protein n=1 Tax=Amorphus sp. 3PC139-8 TaxID=2735676 RepID=UPI00345C86CA
MPDKAEAPESRGADETGAAILGHGGTAVSVGDGSSGGAYSGFASSAQASRRWPKFSLATFLAVTSGLLVAISLLSVLFLAVAANFQNTYSLLNQNAVLVMEALEERIKGSVETVAPAVSQLARFYSAGEIGLEASEKRTALVQGVLSGAPIIEAVVFYTKDFEASGIYREKGGTFRTADERRVISPLIKKALGTIKPGDVPRWGPPVHVDGATYMNVAAPLTHDGRLDGYVVAAVGIDGFSRVVEEIGRENNGAVALLYGWDTVFAYTDRAGQLVPIKSSEADPTVPLADTGDPVLRAFNARRPLDGFERAWAAGVSVSSLRADGENYVVMLQTLEGYGPKPWIAVLDFPEYEMMDELHRLRGSLVVGLGLLILSLIVAVFAGKLVARAIGRIAPEADRIARFEFESVRRLPESRIHEVDSEARAFNAMVEGLRTFSMYVPRQLVQRLVQRGFAEATRSRSQQATVLFTDIVGFTALSEHMSAEEASARLNTHFAGLVKWVEEEFGIVDKFMGDGMMAFWAEHDVVDHADHAVRAAFAIKRTVQAAAAEARAKGEPALRIRIGLHSGPVIVGNLGSPDRVNYTIVGDTVNVASRLESFGRNIDACADAIILASEETVNRLTVPVIREPVGAAHLPGREALVEIWRLIDVDWSHVRKPDPAIDSL